MKHLKTLLYTSFILAILFLSACEKKETPDTQQLVDQAIAAHGGQNLDKAVVTFKFRDRQYRALRDQGAYVYSRTFTDDSTGQRMHDVMSNSGFKRTANDVEVELPEERQQAFTSSINSVVYFALLPYFLNDAAVQKEYLGEATLKGEPYHKIKVTFAQEGGGEDYEDEYVYWFHQKNHTMDYLAYSFKEEDGSRGTRFREAVNPRKVGDVLFQDYINYTSKEKFPLQNFDKAFEAGKLEKVSEINLEDVKVSKL
ncbi:DUF6503 family protein [Pontibacter cellulosilyticus]|uniref:Deoxyribose-phosphate aldolase n=1 Tax=Pontibacter cellulosilyticus TaxID=1720253 RepID=A0A923N738_9BACT|nr:DUF6503 family protein [Pontibacter cellulosilyticus]MBC5993441.1 hypothetical protein [Pontibacter cellulosilyticus]